MTTYTNPVIDADWPDPDVVRVGDDYFLVASSFNRAPGLPVLHSRDLVTWEHVTNALPALPPHDHYNLPRHGSGVWAPSLRHHDGTFYLTYPDPDHGIFVLTAADPAGRGAPRTCCSRAAASSTRARSGTTTGEPTSCTAGRRAAAA